MEKDKSLELPYTHMVCPDCNLGSEKALHLAWVAQLSASHGYGTKILPEALDWYYTGSRTHVFENILGYEKDELVKKYEKAGNLLQRSMCLNIPVKADEKYISDLINIITAWGHTRLGDEREIECQIWIAYWYISVF